MSVYQGPYPELREQLRSIAISNGHSGQSFGNFWRDCMVRDLTPPEINLKFDKSVISKKKGSSPRNNPEYQSKRKELHELAISQGLSDRQFNARWHNALSKHYTIDGVVEYLHKSITGNWSEDTDWDRVRKLVMSRGYINYKRGYAQISDTFLELWKQWDEEGIDVPERERRISASKYGYKKDHAEELKVKGLFPPFSLLSDPLSHLYQEFATIAYNNDFTVTQSGKVIINLTFRRWWKQCVDNNLTEEQRRQSFKDRGFDKPRKKLVHGQKTEEQKQAREWAYNLAKTNGYTDEDKPHLLPRSCWAYIARLLRNWTSLEDFQSRVTRKYGKPNYKNIAIVNQILDDTEDKWSVLFENELDEDLFRNTKKRVDFIDQLTRAIGHYKVAIHLVNTLYQDEVDRSNEPLEQPQEVESHTTNP